MNSLQNLLTMQQMMFHNQQLNRIKNSIKGCTYVAYSRYKDNYQIETVINGQREEFPLMGAPIDTDANSYKDLKNLILAKYEIA